MNHADCFMFCLMTHGECTENTTLVEFSDGSYMKVDEIITKFTNENFKPLKQKPKIFFFPVCRGEWLQSLVLIEWYF